MNTNFAVAHVSAHVQPTTEMPFVVDLLQGVPVGLRSIHETGPARDPSAVIIALPEKSIYVPALSPVIQAIAVTVAPSVGIILTNPHLHVQAVLGVNDIGSGLNAVSKHLLQVSGYIFQPLPGEDPDLPSQVCKCPVDDCPSPPVFVHQTGQRISLCPIHNRKRECKLADG